MDYPQIQKKLSNEQIEAFYHDLFVEAQTRHFISLIKSVSADKVVVDIGGGCGHFAKSLSQIGAHRLRVVDMDAISIDACKHAGISAIQGDAISPHVVGDEDIVCFNLILHHLVGNSEQITLELQRKALSVWRPHVRAVFVNEYIYESYLPNFSGWLIFQITKSSVLSWIGQKISIVIPTLKANTFGVGVRFRAHDEWRRVFSSAGYLVKDSVIGDEEHVSMPRRMLLIKRIRRDSFLLEPSASQ